MRPPPSGRLAPTCTQASCPSTTSWTLGERAALCTPGRALLWTCCSTAPPAPPPPLLPPAALLLEAPCLRPPPCSSLPAGLSAGPAHAPDPDPTPAPAVPLHTTGGALSPAHPADAPPPGLVRTQNPALSVPGLTKAPGPALLSAAGQGMTAMKSTRTSA